jgi:hypothetical protein
MHSPLSYSLLSVAITSAITASAQPNKNTELLLPIVVPLVVPAGTPLRVSLTQRVSRRLGEVVVGELIDPLFAFDREVVPSGTQVFGTVIGLTGISPIQRATAISGGDFTPLRQADVEFDTLVLGDGQRVMLHTIPTPGRTTIAATSTLPRAPQPHTGVFGRLRSAVQGKISSERKTVSKVTRGPDKKERLEEFLLLKLPYHPQYLRRGTRFDAELIDPLVFGTATLSPADVRLLGSQPSTDISVVARLVTPLDSGTATKGEPVAAILSGPVFSSDHALLFPEGARLTGVVTMVQRARWWRRGGQLRFSFQDIELSERWQLNDTLVDEPRTTLHASLSGAEAASNVHLKLDAEGGVTATESKVRFIAPAIAAFRATRSDDNDLNIRTGLPENHTGGRPFGRGSAFGLLGTAAGKSSPAVARALGFYGMAWSAYVNIITPGSDVRFPKNARITIRFDGQPSTLTRSTNGSYSNSAQHNLSEFDDPK